MGGNARARQPGKPQRQIHPPSAALLRVLRSFAVRTSSSPAHDLVVPVWTHTVFSMPYARSGSRRRCPAPANARASGAQCVAGPRQVLPDGQPASFWTRSHVALNEKEKFYILPPNCHRRAKRRYAARQRHALCLDQDSVAVDCRRGKVRSGF